MTARFIIEADGGSRGNPGPAAYGTVIRNADTGEVLVEAAGYLGETTNNVAEYTGLLTGLQLIAELDASAKVEARLDSRLVVEQMSGRWRIKHPVMRELAIAARDAFVPEQVTYVWVPRAENTAADALVNECLDEIGSGRDGEILRRLSA
jgi:ribonuclease H / adenosylcobalamin/alpha-ribazole phosphatase